MPPAPMDPAMMGMDPSMGMDPGGPVPPPTATPLGGVASAPGTAVDQGAMGMAPMPAPSEDDLIMSSLQAVLGKWSTQGSAIAGEKNSLLQTLMMLASSQPPSAPEAFVEGGSPTNFGMVPTSDQLPGGMGAAPEMY